MLTANEVRDFILYCSENPIDDQSNHHFPIAQLGALTANINRAKDAKPYLPSDFMLGGGESEEASDDLEGQILNGDW